MTGLLPSLAGVVSLVGDAVHPLLPSANWHRFVGSEIQIAKPAGPAPVFLRESLAPYGPFKLLPGKRPDRVILVADFPLALGMTQNERAEPLAEEFVSDSTAGPLFSPAPGGVVQVWAENLKEALEALGSGVGPDAATESVRQSLCPDPQGFADLLALRGWKASRKDTEVRVNFESRAYFAQVLLRFTPRGLLAETVLANTAGWQASSLRAAAALAEQANERLKLARLVYREESHGGSLLAQVHLGRQSIESPWLDAALVCLRSATDSLSRELPLLADAELGNWILNSGC